MHRASDHNVVIETKTCPKMSEFMYKSTTSGTNVLIVKMHVPLLGKKDHVYLWESLLYNILIKCPGNKPSILISARTLLHSACFKDSCKISMVSNTMPMINWDGKPGKPVKTYCPQAKGQRFNPPPTTNTALGGSRE